MNTKEFSKSWINFKELRSRLTFEQLLNHYGVTLTQKGDQLVGFCPIPSHNGKHKTPSFSAHPDKGVFQCFGCGAKGNVLDFAVLMDKGDPRKGVDLRRTALNLQKVFNIYTNSNPQNVRPSQESKERGLIPGEEEIVNAKLTFRLKVDSKHPYLAGRGFFKETMDYFGVGFCERGLFKNRITIPLHDSEGDLIGYAGRVLDDSIVTPENPKYLFPGKRNVDGKIHAFKKSLFLYNGYRFTMPLDHLIVVEGFASVWWLTQNGFENVVALMGSTASPEQIDLILGMVQPDGAITLLMDGDPAGNRCLGEVSVVLANKRKVNRIVKEGKQPTDFSPTELYGLLTR